MIPKISENFQNDFEFANLPTGTYKFNINEDKICGFTDGLEAMKQAIYLILNTERYEYIIYSWDYGIELLDLFGKPIPYVIPELERRITEALIQDDRILSVDNFIFDHKRNKVFCEFIVHTIFGDIKAQKEVDI